MHPFRYSIHVRLQHPNMDPDLISSAMGEEPFRKWQAGYARTNPRGGLLGGVNKHTYWCAQGVRREGQDLAETLESQLQKLEDKKNFLVDFCSTGGKIMFYVSWFTNEKNTGETFDWELLKRLAALQIDLGIDVYGGRDPADDRKKQ